MVYKVIYKEVTEILDDYNVFMFPDNWNFQYECLVINGIAKFIKTDMPYSYSGRPEMLLKQLVRCYIINYNEMPNALAMSEIFDRYR